MKVPVKKHEISNRAEQTEAQTCMAEYLQALLVCAFLSTYCKQWWQAGQEATSTIQNFKAKYFYLF